MNITDKQLASLIAFNAIGGTISQDEALGMALDLQAIRAELHEAVSEENTYCGERVKNALGPYFIDAQKEVHESGNQSVCSMVVIAIDKIREDYDAARAEVEKWKAARDKVLDYSIDLQRLIEHHVKGELVSYEIASCCDHHARMIKVHEDAALAKVERLRGTLTNLVTQIRLVGNDYRYHSVWSMSQIHQGPYEGPTYIKELEEAEAVLAGHGEGGLMEERKAPDIGEFDVEIKVSELESLKADLARVTVERDQRSLQSSIQAKIMVAQRDFAIQRAEKAEAERDAARAEVERLKKYLNVYVRRLWLAPERLEIPEGTFTQEEIDEIWTTVASFEAGPAKEAKPCA